MKIRYMILTVIITITLGGCNDQAKAELQGVIDQYVHPETLYTSSSYENYISALNNANSVNNNPFSSFSTIIEAQTKLQSSIDSLKPSTKAVYRIEYSFTLKSNNSVGNEWRKTVTANGRELKNGDTLIAVPDSTVTIQGLIIENDTVPDIGKGTIVLILKDTSTSSTKITVQENRGQYSGNTAVWELECSATLIERI